MTEPPVRLRQASQFEYLKMDFFMIMKSQNLQNWSLQDKLGFCKAVNQIIEL